MTTSNSPPAARFLSLLAIVGALASASIAACDDGEGNGGEGGGAPGGSGGGQGGAGGGQGGGGAGGSVADTCPCDPGAHCDVATDLCAPGCRADGDCAAGERCNVTTEACFAPCTRDDMCGRNSGQRCDFDSGLCVAADNCEGDFTCPNTTVCPELESCVCVPDTTQPAGGSCWRRRDVCETCESNDECGSGQIYDKPRDCVEYTYGDARVAVCLPKRGAGSCPAGTIPGTEEDGSFGYCVPQTLDCAALHPCDGDEDCTDPAAPVCDRSRQLCVPGCKYNFETDRTDGCAPGKVCHAKPEYLRAELLNDCATVGLYGIGRCDEPCETDTDCTTIDPTFTCEQDGAAKRCRPAGCLDDRECPEAAGDYRGYCDPNTYSCLFENCRTGPDPRNGCGDNTPYEDCAATHKCVEDASKPIGYGICTLKNCIDNGGAALDCRIGEYCAGEPMKDLATGAEEGSPLVPPPGVPVGVCYELDAPQWCQSGCDGHDACRGANSPYSLADNPDWCLFDFNGDGAGECTFGCEYNAQCPGRWSCNSKSLEVQCEGVQHCETDADCGGGSTCAEPKVAGRLYTNWPAGVAPFKVCECTTSEACGAGYTCNEGIGSAGTDPSDAGTYDTVQGRYCAASTACGGTGSCEFIGKYNPPQNQGDPPTPMYQCGCGAGTAAGCPDSYTGDGPFLDQPSRCGASATDRLYCVFGQMCQPRFYTDSNGDQACGVPP